MYVQKGQRVQLPNSEMHRWAKRGLRNVEILRRLEEEHNIKVVRSAITNWKRRNGYTVRESTPERLELIPWRVAQEHSGDRLYRVLMSEVRLRSGKKLARPDMLRRDRFFREMAEMDGDPVIAYDRTNGWYLVPRRPGVDKDLIRDPRLDAGGREIPDSELWQ